MTAVAAERADNRTHSATDTDGAAWMMAAGTVMIGIGSVANSAVIATLAITAALAAAIVGMIDPAARMLPIRARAVLTVLAVGVGLEAITLPTRAPIANAGYVSALLVLAGTGLYALLFARRWRIPLVGVVAVGHFVLMAWMISAGGEPDIDVYVIQQEGAAALLAGANPFDVTFSVHADPESPYYASEVLEGNRLKFGFIYPPLSLLMAVPGYALAGDYRYGAAAAVAIAAVLIATIRPGRLATGAALLLLFAPMTQQVLYWGWTDPFVILLLAGVVWLAARQAASTPVAFGLLIAVKQYMFPVFALGIVLLRTVRNRVGLTRFAAITVGVAALTIVPFILWDASALVYSTITTHLLQPFRPDSLSIPALLWRAGFPETPSVVGFVLGALALAFAFVRAARSPAGLCCATAVVLIVFFLFSKQAFFHYYFLTFAALACGVAATATEPSTEATARAKP